MGSVTERGAYHHPRRDRERDRDQEHHGRGNGDRRRVRGVRGDDVRVTYPFVKSAAQYGRRKGRMQSFLVHMAEGGGTVGYLSRPNPRGVSVHYVVEYSGQVVQMVRELDASGSVNPRDIRATDDTDG